MYYLVHIEDISPEPDPNYDYYEIQTEPPRTNSSHEIKTEGWCGTTNDVHVWAYGEFDSIEDAEQALAEFTGEDGYRNYADNDDSDRDRPAVEDAKNEAYGVVRRFWHGSLPQLDKEASDVFVNEVIEESVEADSTDAELEKLVRWLNEAAQKEWRARLQTKYVYKLAEDRREELQEEAE